MGKKKELTPEQIEAIESDENDIDDNLDDAVGLEPERSIYNPPDSDAKKLANDGYLWDGNGLYCPLNTNSKDKHYLKISRGYDSYLMSVGLVDKRDNDLSFIPITASWNDKQPITVESKTRQQGFGRMAKGIIGKIAEPLLEIGAMLNTVKGYPQITGHFKVFQELEELKGQINDADNEVERIINQRCSPELTEHEQEIVDKVHKEIVEHGLTGYLDKPLKKIHMGDHRNIYRKTLMSLCVMRADYSSFIQDLARAGAGKSHENDIVFDLIVPERYIMLVNDVTLAGFTRYGDLHERYLDRLILLFYDKGGKKSLDNIEEVMNILKMLITEGKYHKDLTEKDKKGNPVMKSLDLVVDSICAVYSTPNTDDDAIADDQLESRSLKCTPADVDIEEILDHISYLMYMDSKQSKDKADAEETLKNFSMYLLSLVNDTDVIINPYMEIFKRHSKTIDDRGNITREFERQLHLFDAYCRINKHECKHIEGNTYGVTPKLVEDYFNDINLKNALSPTQSDFIEMLMKGNNKDNPLKLVNETDDPIENSVNLADCMDKAIEQFKEDSSYSERYSSDGNKYNPTLDRYGNTDEEDITYDILTKQHREQVLKQILEWYKIKGGKNSVCPIFFRVRDVHNHFRRYKAYKNVSNVSDILDKLRYKGYVNRLDKLDGENIYYLTTECNNLKQQKLTEEDKEKANIYLETVGYYDKFEGGKK